MLLQQRQRGINVSYRSNDLATSFFNDCLQLKSDVRLIFDNENGCMIEQEQHPLLGVTCVKCSVSQSLSRERKIDNEPVRVPIVRQAAAELATDNVTREQRSETLDCG